MTDRRETDFAPPPGSPAATSYGCKCPGEDNGDGQGVPYPLGRRWQISERCPLHAPRLCYSPTVDPKRQSSLTNS